PSSLLHVQSIVTQSQTSFPTRRSSDLFYIIKTKKDNDSKTSTLHSTRSCAFTNPRNSVYEKQNAPSRTRLEKNRSETPCKCRKADRKSTRLNSSHVKISYAVFCLKKKN